jgi:hypothetical protein
MNEHLRCPPPATGLDVRIATTRKGLIETYEAVYRSYVAKSYISPNSGGIVYQPAFGLPSTATIVARTEQDGLLGTMTVVRDNPLGLQLETEFPGELRSLRRRGRRFCEITCLVVRPSARFRPTAVFFAMGKFAIHYALYRHYDDLLMGVHPRHYAFYWHHYRAYLEGSCRPYASANGKLAVCCRIDLRHLCRNMSEEMREYNFSNVPAARMFHRPPLRPEDQEYFLERSGLAEVAVSDECTEYACDAA